MNSNKKIGNEFETEFCERLSKEGFWCHNMTQNASGQPADVIAVKNQLAYLIDCKVCTRDAFSLSRIEENQIFSMETWDECGNGVGWFAIRFSGGIYMIGLPSLQNFSYSKSVLREDDAKRIGIELESWLRDDD